MFANSWLYHYYAVQSKIQFGIPYEGPARVQATNDPYLQQQQQQEQQQQLLESNDLHNHNNHSLHHHHHHHHSFHNYSPNSLQTPLTHSYLTHSHHVSSYGYHSPVAAQHQGSPVVNHFGNTTSHLNYHGSMNEAYRPYAYRIDPVLPVDYSGHVSPQTQHNTSSSNGSIKSTDQSNSESGSPPAKRRALNRREPLFILPIEHQQETSSDETIHTELYQTTTGDGGTVLLTTVLPGRYSNNTHIKAISNEPSDLIDQWSPPWSETTQKVPDIAQQELSYLSRTPPTPTSAPLTSSNGVAFSFDWMPEQFVPIVEHATHNNNNHTNHTVPNGCLSHTHSLLNGMPIVPAPLSLSPLNEHKFYNLDRSPDNSNISRGKHFYPDDF